MSANALSIAPSSRVAASAPRVARRVVRAASRSSSTTTTTDKKASQKARRGARTTPAATARAENMDQHDLYALLGVEPTSSVDDIKLAYRAVMKRCHPDVAAASMTATDASDEPSSASSSSSSFAFAPADATFDEEDLLASTIASAAAATTRERLHREREAAEVSQLLNRAWEILRDPRRRAAYDSGRALFGDLSLFSDRVFDGTPLSKNARPDIDVALFVDEGLCIGCRACYQCAPETFSMDPELNVARVSTQWANDEMALEDAVQSCPKSCIHTVSRAELPMLEWIHASQPKQRVVPCTVESQSGKGRGLEESPFNAMERFERRRAELLRDAEADRARRERREEAAAAMARVSNIVSWTDALFGGSSRTAKAKDDDDDAATPPACPLPAVYVNAALLRLPPAASRKEGNEVGSNA